MLPEVATSGPVGNLESINNVISNLRNCSVKTVLKQQTKQSEISKVKTPFVKHRRASYFKHCMRDIKLENSLILAYLIKLSLKQPKNIQRNDEFEK